MASVLEKVKRPLVMFACARMIGGRLLYFSRRGKDGVRYYTRFSSQAISFYHRESATLTRGSGEQVVRITVYELTPEVDDG